MQQRRARQFWAHTALPEAWLLAAKWTAVRTGAMASLWPATPRWLGRYVGELSSAHIHSAPQKT